MTYYEKLIKKIKRSFERKTVHHLFSHEVKFLYDSNYLIPVNESKKKELLEYLPTNKNKSFIAKLENYLLVATSNSGQGTLYKTEERFIELKIEWDEIVKKDEIFKKEIEDKTEFILDKEKYKKVLSKFLDTAKLDYTKKSIRLLDKAVIKYKVDLMDFYNFQAITNYFIDVILHYNSGKCIIKDVVNPSAKMAKEWQDKLIAEGKQFYGDRQESYIESKLWIELDSGYQIWIIGEMLKFSVEHFPRRKSFVPLLENYVDEF
ncbi:MAG: hypothetical protein Kapaf2KO_22960 [Candidatus Kapaibacteriales bacterium]